MKSANKLTNSNKITTGASVYPTTVRFPLRFLSEHPGFFQIALAQTQRMYTETQWQDLLSADSCYQWAF